MSTEYVLFFAKVGTRERHSLAKTHWSDDLPRLAARALWIHEDFEKQQGTYYRLHRNWSTGMEIWESPPGGEGTGDPPDRRLAYIRWEDDALTVEEGVDPALFGEGV